MSLKTPFTILLRLSVLALLIQCWGCLADTSTDKSGNAGIPTGPTGPTPTDPYAECYALETSCTVDSSQLPSGYTAACDPTMPSEQESCVIALSNRCPAPTLDQCNDTDWINTQCGQAFLYLDRRYIRSLGYDPGTHDRAQISAILATIPAPPQPPETCQDFFCLDGLRVWGASSSTRYVPGSCYRKSQEATNTWARVQPAAVSNVLDGTRLRELQTFDPAVDETVPDFSDYATLLQYRAETRDAPGTLTSLNSWNANGEQVYSCEEFVYEKYYDFARWYLAARDRSNRAQYNIAFNQQNWANKDSFFLMRNGSWMSSPPTSSLSVSGEPRNALRDPRVRRYAATSVIAGTLAGTLAPVDANRMNRLVALAIPSVVPVPTWHRTMSGRLALGAGAARPTTSPSITRTTIAGTSDMFTTGWADEELDDLDVEMDKLLAIAAGPDPNADVQPPANNQGQAFLSILAKLDSAGCLTDQVNACDWSPRRFVRSVSQAKGSRRSPYFYFEETPGSWRNTKDIWERMEDSYQLCKANVPDPMNFNNGATPGAAGDAIEPPATVTWSFRNGKSVLFWRPIAATSACYDDYCGTVSTAKQVISYTSSQYSIQDYFILRSRFKRAVSRYIANERLRSLALIQGASLDADGRVRLPGVNSSVTKSGRELLGNEYLGIGYSYDYTQVKAGANSCQQEINGSFDSRFYFLTIDSPLLTGNGYWRNYAGDGATPQNTLDVRVRGISIFNADARQHQPILRGSAPRIAGQGHGRDPLGSVEVDREVMPFLR